MSKHWFTAYLTSYYSKGKTLGLDVGSGYRNWHEFFQCKYLAVDLPSKLNQVKSKRPDVSCTSCYLPFKDNSFDFLSCYSVIPEIINIDLALEEMKRVLKPNGIAIFIVQNLRAMKLNKQNFVNQFDSKMLNNKLQSHNFKSIKHKNFQTLLFSHYYNVTSLYQYAIVKIIK